MTDKKTKLKFPEVLKGKWAFFLFWTPLAYSVVGMLCVAGGIFAAPMIFISAFGFVFMLIFAMFTFSVMFFAFFAIAMIVFFVAPFLVFL